MQVIQFTALQANLGEIYVALHSKSKVDKLPLEAVSSSSVRYQGCLTGKIYQVWHRIQPFGPSLKIEDVLLLIITSLFDQAVHAVYDARQRRIWNHMRQIDQIWQNSLSPQLYKQQRERYKCYLAEELKGSVEAGSPIYLADFDERSALSFNEQEEKVHRHTLVNFHQATHLFWSLFVHDEHDNAAIRQPLMYLLKPSSTLQDKALFEALKNEGRWVQMEGITQQSIPVALLAKLDGNHSLTMAENRRLQQWVQALNRCHSSITSTLFFHVLHEVLHVIYLQGSSTLTLTDLLSWLDQQGCQLLFQEDPVHMDWREKLRPGDIIECNGKELILGRQLSPDKEINDRFKVFELRNYPDYVVKIAHNQLLLPIEANKGRSEEEHWGVRLVDTIEAMGEEEDIQVSGLDRQGRCVVLEKLFFPLSEHAWTSQNGELNQDDEKVALVFANHIYCMAQWKAISQHLSLSHLMWDKAGVLKSTRPLKKGSDNYNELETYCAQAAKGNLFVLSFLMHVSQLHAHPVALYYREAVEYALENGKTDLIGRALPLGHRQEIYHQHVKNLCDQALELRESCCKMLIAHLRRKGEYSHKQEAKTQRAVIDKLLQFYRASPTPGKFPPDMGKQIVKSFDQAFTSDSLLNPSYYQEKYKTMMKYNEAENLECFK